MTRGIRRTRLRILNLASRKITALADRSRVPSFLIPDKLFSWLYDLEYESRVDLERLAARSSNQIRDTSELISDRRLHIFDIGARGGILPIFTHLQSFATWTLFEPDPHEYQRLTRRYRGQRNVSVEPLAVAATSGEVGLFESLKRGVSSTLHPIYGGRFRVTQTRKVAAVSIADYCTEKGIAPDVIKLDTQGSELEILKGLGRNRPDVIWTEIQGASYYLGATSPEAVEEFLVGLGYSLLSKHGADYLFGLVSSRGKTLQDAFLMLFELQQSDLG